MSITDLPADRELPVDPDEPLLIEWCLPAYDAALVEHVIVDADVATTWHAVKTVDLLRVRTPLLVTSIWVRDLPNRLARWRGLEVERPLEALTLDRGLPGWEKLGEIPEREFAFGAVGVFWTPQITWRDVSAAEFSAFAEPGYGKIAAAFVVVPYGLGRTLLAYEVRTATTSPAARRGFLRYWRVVRPFVRHIMRASLRTLKTDAEDAQRTLRQPRAT